MTTPAVTTGHSASASAPWRMSGDLCLCIAFARVCSVTDFDSGGEEKAIGGEGGW